MTAAKIISENMNFAKFKKEYITSMAILAALLLILFAAGGQSGAINGKLNERKLIPQPERYTELYFADYESLPRKIESGKPLDFSFVIRNLEGDDTNYPYVVYLEYADGRRENVQTGAVSLANEGSKTIIVTDNVAADPTIKKVIVQLTEKDQEISFILEDK